MYKKLYLIVILSFIIISGCSTSQNWTKTDFGRYAKSKNGSKKFYLKYYGHVVNLKMDFCCINYIDSRNSINVLPVNKIKRFMEKKYGVIINISEFKRHQRKGHFKTIVSKDKNGKTKTTYNRRYISLDGISHTGGAVLLAYGTWIYQNWSEYKKKVSFYTIKDKVEYGKTNQMQIHLETHILGPTATIWLRIKKGKPDKDGYYKLLNVVEEKIYLPFSGKGCNLKPMAVSIKKIPKLLKTKMQ